MLIPHPSPKRRPVRRRRMNLREWLVLLAAVTAALMLCTVMILHMKLIPSGADGGSARISLIEQLRGWQPFLESEGALESKSYEMAPVTEIPGIRDGMVDDGLDLDQIQEGQFCILFLGLDESRSNTDVILLVMFDLRGGAVHILQIPRDTFVPGFTDFEACKLNSVYARGNPNRTPVQRTADCLEALFRIPIDRYITTGCGDIAEIVDLLGGVPVTMPYPITFEADKIIPQGEQILTGAQAEWLLRFRHDYTEGDIGRMKAQRIFMAAAMRKVSGMGKLRLLQVIRSITEQKLIGSDLTVDEIAKLGDFASSRSAEQFTVHLLPGEGYNYQPPVTHGITSYSVWMMHKQPVIDLLNQYFRPYFEPEADLPVADLLTPAEYQYTGYDSDSTDFQKLENGETFMGN